MALLTASTDLRRVLTDAATVAVLGAHEDPWRAAYYVPDYLYRHGYRVVPVNPKLVGATLWGEPVRATLAEAARAAGPIDVVCVFRRAEHLPGHEADLAAMAPPPAVVWLQLGIRHPAVARALSARGVDVIEDRCMLQDHKTLGLERRP